MSQQRHALVGAIFLALVVAVLAAAIAFNRSRQPPAASAEDLPLPLRERLGAERPAGAALTPHCGDFVSFAFGCGIGRPPRDPTVDVGTQHNNDLVIMLSVTDECRAGRPPYDEGLIKCFLAAGDDCDRYRTCADGVVRARGDAGPPR